MKRLRTAGWAVSLCLLLGAPGASARGVSPLKATAEQQAGAQQHYDAGVEHYKAQRFEAAQKEFLAAYDIVASPNAHVMYARALRESGDIGRAVEELAETREEAAALAVEVPRYAAAAELAEKELEAILPKIAAVAVEIEGATEGATVKVGGRSVARENWVAVSVAPGRVAVSVSLPDGRRARQTIDAQRGVIARVKLTPTAREPDDDDPEPTPAASAPPGSSAVPPAGGTGPEPDRATAQHPYRTWAYVAGGVGVAGLLLFAIEGSMANSTFADLEGACPDRRCPSDRQSDIDRGRQQQTLANVGLVLGVVGLGAGTALYVLDLGASRTQVAVGPTGAVLRGSF